MEGMTAEARIAELNGIIAQQRYELELVLVHNAVLQGSCGEAGSPDGQRQPQYQ
jgi:hypothetical protein